MLKVFLPHSRHSWALICRCKRMWTACKCRIVLALRVPGVSVWDQTSIRDHNRLFTWSEHTEVCKRRSKDSPLIRFHVKQKRLNTASDRRFLWQWNIPGEKRDMFVGKRSFEVTWVLLPRHMCARVTTAGSEGLYTVRERERTTQQLRETV